MRVVKCKNGTPAFRAKVATPNNISANALMDDVVMKKLDTYIEFAVLIV